MSIVTDFTPYLTYVDSITNANPGIVTTTTNHGYASGLYVRFFFPLDVGMNQLSDKIAKITKINDTSFSIGIDTTNFDLYSPVGTSQLAQVIPIAEDADSLTQAKQNGGNIVPEF